MQCILIVTFLPSDNIPQLKKTFLCLIKRKYQFKVFIHCVKSLFSERKDKIDKIRCYLNIYRKKKVFIYTKPLLKSSKAQLTIKQILSP